jgi:hypothetical protein
MRYEIEDRLSVSKFKHSFAANKQIIVPYSPGFGTKKISSFHRYLYLLVWPGPWQTAVRMASLIFK